MIKWFKNLSDTNKIAIIVPITLTIIAGLFATIKVAPSIYRYIFPKIIEPAPAKEEDLNSAKVTLELSGWKVTVNRWHGHGKEYGKIGNQKEVKVKVKILKDGLLIYESDIDKVLVKGSDGSNTDYSLNNIGLVPIEISNAKEVVVMVNYTGSKGEEKSKFVFRKINNWQPDKKSLSFTSDQTSKPEHFDASVHMQARVRYR